MASCQSYGAAVASTGDQQELLVTSGAYSIFTNRNPVGGNDHRRQRACWALRWGADMILSSIALGMQFTKKEREDGDGAPQLWHELMSHLK